MRWLCSTIGSKQLVGITGLGLSGFLFTHMLGNMLILVGPEAYNKYSHALITNPLILVAEVGLLAMFVAHLFLASRISIANWRARESQYAVLPNGPKGTPWSKRTLWAQGLVILVFLILHLITFKYGQHYTAVYGGIEMRDLHKLVIGVFSQTGYVIWYCVALVILFFHLWHGFGSAFQTIGINHPRYQRAIHCLSTGYAVIVAAGFLSQPLYVYFLN